jgi:ketosteroid isomerase-like protein
VSIEPDGDPEQEALLADSIGLALLVVLENLTPAERLAFVLHDMFEVPFDELAPIVGRTPAATRQLASRARRRVKGLAPAPDPDILRQREVVDAFLAASRAGDFEALVEVLDPNVVFRIDSGGTGPLARPPITGAPAVAQQLLARGSRFAPHARPAIVNGTAGLIIAPGPRVRAVVGFTIATGRITAINLITDTEKLSGIAR